ncbi:Hydroxyindole-O-methyltransferase and related SAM-dependent methyltransferases [Ceraceosorus bombacis]|uniref:Hydroxyindole-O-methyltransferase and related SAM-dependent methyltransferases n=1 Tax=Ceraceosorus bombacis TaxID=401625 RepID=A0A0P1B9L0_9BASI|nr:Hydroxyindole-O-methyltransferase and related SAM-dependent methyltransferases [Ceraceosorus bombacis]
MSGLAPWDKQGQLAALKQLRDSTDNLIKYISQQDGYAPIVPSAAWVFPYTPASKHLADSWRNDWSLALSKTLNPTQLLVEFLCGDHESSALHAFHTLGLAEVLPGPNVSAGIEAPILAEKVGAHVQGLRSVLRMLKRARIVEEEGEPLSDRWRGTVFTEVLRKESPIPMGSMIEYARDEANQAVQLVPELVKRENAGKSGISIKYQQPDLFALYATDGDARRIQRFNLAMQSLSPIIAGGPTEDYPWKDVTGLVVDIGGGVGGQTIPLVARWDHLKIQIQDTEPVINDAKHVWAGMPPPWTARVQLRAHDFLKVQPDDTAAAAQIYFLRFVLHDWADSICIDILKALRSKAKPDSKVLLLEVVVFGDDSRYANVLSVHLGAVAGSHERTESEYNALLEKAGWRPSKTYRTRSIMSVIEAVPA